MKNAQVWVETVIYTLIGLTLIGVVLSLALPKINAYKDRVIVEQSIDAMNSFDAKIKEVIDAGPGNVRKVDFFFIKRGNLEVNGEADEILFEIDKLTKPYSEIGRTINVGPLYLITIKNGKTSNVKIASAYYHIANLTYAGKEIQQVFSESSTPYSFSIENKGVSNGKVLLDIREVSGGN